METPLHTWADMLKDSAEAGGGDSFDALPVGRYDLKVNESEPKCSDKGNRYWKLTTEVTTGPYKGRLVWTNLVLTPTNPKALPFFFNKNAALGLDRKFFEGNPTDEQVAAAHRGAHFRGELILKEYNGSQTNEIKKYLPAENGAHSAAPSGPPAPPMTASAPEPPF